MTTHRSDADKTQSLPLTPETHPDKTATWNEPTPIDSFGRFQVVRAHARGGLGKVSIALDRELGREVALKEILEDRSRDARAQQRFIFEAEITGSLEHPGIVPVYGLGRDRAGRPFYAMRFVRGKTLKEAIRGFHEAHRQKAVHDGWRDVEFRGLLNRFVAVCDAIAYAHSRGVIHRDLKPGNILLGPYGETLVVDWGLAKRLDQPHDSVDSAEPPLQVTSSGSNPFTVQGSAVGTPPYMSPEQAEGRLDLHSPATDVYGLGATLYTLLTGRPPIDDDSSSETLSRVRLGQFPRPRAIQPRLPAPLEAICLRAMARQPGDRYGSAKDLAAEIEKWLADEPVSVYRETWLDRRRRWLRRHRGVARVAVISLILTLLGLVCGSLLINQQRVRAEQQEELALRNAKRALQVVEKFLIQTGDDQWSRLPQFESYRLEMAQMAVNEFRSWVEQYPDNDELVSQLALATRRFANLYRMLNRLPEADAEMQRAVAAVTRLRGRHPQDANVRIMELEIETDALDLRHRYRGSVESETQAAALLARAASTRTDFPDQPMIRVLEAFAQLPVATIWCDLGRHAESVQLSRLIAETFEAQAGAQPDSLQLQTLVALAWIDAAIIGLDAGDLPWAHRCALRAVTSSQRLLDRSPDQSTYRSLAADAKVAAARVLLALRQDQAQIQVQLDDAITELTRLHSEFPATASFARELADALTVRSRFQRAVETWPATETRSSPTRTPPPAVATPAAPKQAEPVTGLASDAANGVQEGSASTLTAAISDARRAVELLTRLDAQAAPAPAFARSLAEARAALGLALQQAHDPTAAMELEQAQASLRRAQQSAPGRKSLQMALQEIETRP